MAKTKVGTTTQASPRKEYSLDEQQLAQILGQPTWNAEQAVQVLADQRSSGQGIAAYAKERGLSAGRISNWKTRLKQAVAKALPEAAGEQQEEKLVNVQDAALNHDDPGERQVHEYLIRATQGFGGEEPMWRLLGMRRDGTALLCVVRWVQDARNPEPFSVVTMDLTAPALWWKKYATQQAAQQALEHRCHGRAEPQATEGPALMRVQVRGPRTPQAEPPRPLEACDPSGGITVWLPSGVHIQIPDSVSETRLRLVLERMGAPS